MKGKGKVTRELEKSGGRNKRRHFEIWREKKRKNEEKHLVSVASFKAVHHRVRSCVPLWTILPRNGQVEEERLKEKNNLPQMLCKSNGQCNVQSCVWYLLLAPEAQLLLSILAFFLSPSLRCFCWVSSMAGIDAFKTSVHSSCARVCNCFTKNASFN